MNTFGFYKSFCSVQTMFFSWDKKKEKKTFLKNNNYTLVESKGIFFCLMNGATSIVYSTYNQKIASLNLLNWNFIWHKHQIYSIMVCFFQTSDCVKHRAWSIQCHGCSLLEQEEAPWGVCGPSWVLQRNQRAGGKTTDTIPKSSLQISPWQLLSISRVVKLKPAPFNNIESWIKDGVSRYKNSMQNWKG